MPLLLRRRPHAPAIRRGTDARPVMLATIGVPFDAAASSFAVDAAVESAQPLVVVNVVELILAPNACVYRTSWELESEDDSRALAAPAELAASLGVPVERLRISSPHRIDALLEVVAEREPGLLVFGPDRARLRSRVYRKAAKAVRDHCPGLVWLAD